MCVKLSNLTVEDSQIIKKHALDHGTVFFSWLMEILQQILQNIETVKKRYDSFLGLGLVQFINSKLQGID